MARTIDPVKCKFGGYVDPELQKATTEKHKYTSNAKFSKGLERALENLVLEPNEFYAQKKHLFVTEYIRADVLLPRL